MNLTTNKIDTRIPCIFNKIRQSSTFLSIKNYTNNFGEVSNFSIVFHFNYTNAVKKSLDVWSKIKAKGIKEDARLDLLRSYSETLKTGFNHRSTSSHVYARISDMDGNVINGVKLHYRNRELHLCGLLVNKQIVKPVNYPYVISNPFTVERNNLIRLTPLRNYRQFKLINGRFESISLEGITLEQMDLIKKAS